MYDLNVPWPSTRYSDKPSDIQLTNLYNTIATLYALDYSHIVLNFIVGEDVRLPLSTPQQLNPIPMGEIRKKFENFPHIHLFSRITLIVSDPGKTQNVSKINNTGAFDIVAVQPTTEKALQLTTTNLDIDLISLPMSTRLPFFLKHKTVGQALSKGIMFEICYSGLIAGPSGYETSSALGTTSHLSRKNFLSNCLQLIRASRCRGLVFSSGATEPLHVRNYVDIIAVMNSLGLKTSNSKEGFTNKPESVLVKGRLRIKSNKQTVMIGDNTGTESRAGALFLNEEKKNVLSDYIRQKRGVKRTLEVKESGGQDAKKTKMKGM